jgi:hypothetical protein
LTNKVTVILPIWNIHKRGIKRILLSIHSLRNQKCDVIIVDGSSRAKFDDLSGLIKGYDVIHYHLPLDEFNKPKLLNKGIELSKTEYIFCSDGDYIFKSDLIEVCSKFHAPDILLHKKVKMLPAMNLSKDRVSNWKFPETKFNQWGTLANGGMQYASKKFFTDFPYNEEMSGFGAMDNLTTYIAVNNGLKVLWIVESEILHQNHPIEKKISGDNKIKFQRNQKILHDYIEENNLPKLLFR